MHAYMRDHKSILVENVIQLCRVTQDGGFEAVFTFVIRDFDLFEVDLHDAILHLKQNRQRSSRCLSDLMFSYFELIKAISASISSSLRLRFGIFVSDFAAEGSFSLIRNTSGLAVKLERLVAPMSMVQ